MTTTMGVIILPFLLAQAQDWLSQNGALLVAVLALMGTVATGYWGWKQKRTPTGEAQLDDERQYRMELRSENKDQKAEIVALNKQVDELVTQNRQLRREIEELSDIKEQLEAQNKMLLEEKERTAQRIKELEADVLRLTRQVGQLEQRRTPRT